MKQVYPIVLEPTDDGYYVNVPDLEIGTQGESIAESIEMARDAICAWACYEQDVGRTIPEPSDIRAIAVGSTSIITLVDVDFDAYRRKHNEKMVRRNITLPGWLDELATERGVNVSQISTNALKRELNCP